MKFSLNLFYRLVRSLHLRPPQRMTARFPFTGRIKIHIPAGQFYMQGTGKWIENELFWQGIKGYEWGTMSIFMQLAAHSDVIIDVGANTGVYSLVARTVSKNSLIYACEPLPYFAGILAENNRLNNARIMIVEAALASVIGEADFYFPQQGQGNLYSSSLSLDHYRNHQLTKPGSTRVKITTLAALIDAYEIQKIDLVKIDAEGYDAEVIKGLGNYLERFQPALIVEIQSNELSKEIYELLSPMQYHYFGISDFKELQPLPFPKGNEFLNFLCLPPGKLSWLKN